MWGQKGNCFVCARDTSPRLILPPGKDHEPSPGGDERFTRRNESHAPRAWGGVGEGVQGGEFRHTMSSELSSRVGWSWRWVAGERFWRWVAGSRGARKGRGGGE